MKKNLCHQKSVISILLFCTLALLLAATPNITVAGITDGFNKVTVIQGQNNIPALTPNAVIMKIIEYVLALVGVLSLLAIVIGGVLYVTSIGDEQKATRAKNTILYAAIGLIIAGSAWAIVLAIGRIFIPGI